MVRESEQLRFLRDLPFKILAGIVSTSGGRRRQRSSIHGTDKGATLPVTRWDLEACISGVFNPGKEMIGRHRTSMNAPNTPAAIENDPALERRYFVRHRLHIS
jgi:hypothetical protein